MLYSRGKELYSKYLFVSCLLQASRILLDFRNQRSCILPDIITNYMIFLTLLHFTMTYRFLYRHSKLLPAVINTGALFLIVMRQKRDLHGRYRIENKKTLVVQLWPCLLLPQLLLLATYIQLQLLYKYT